MVPDTRANVRTERPFSGLFAFFIALGLTGCVAFVWTTTLPARFSNIKNDIEEVPAVPDSLPSTATIKKALEDIGVAKNAENTDAMPEIHTIGGSPAENEERMPGAFATSSAREVPKTVMISTTTSRVATSTLFGSDTAPD